MLLVSKRIRLLFATKQELPPPQTHFQLFTTPAQSLDQGAHHTGHPSYVRPGVDHGTLRGIIFAFAIRGEIFGFEGSAE